MRSRAPLALSPALLVIRILACVAFLPAGIQDLAMMKFTGEDAAKVRRLMQPVPTSPKTEESVVQPAAFLQSSNDQSTASGTDTDSIEARALFRNAIRIEGTGLGSPVLFAWLAVLFQIVGSILLLPGLLSRVWGLGLCIITGTNFVLLTMPRICAEPMMFLSPNGDQMAQGLGAAQLGLFGCALVILLCGPGAFSLDRLLFGGPRALRRAIADEDEPADYDEE